MAQTSTHVNACDAAIYLDDATGTARDISGSSNRIAMKFRRDMEETRLLDGEGYPLRIGCFKDCSAELRIIYTTASNEALDIINTWYHADGVLSARTLTLYVPDETAGSDIYSGEFILETFDAPATSTEAGPIAVTVGLKSTQAVSLSEVDWWMAAGLTPWAVYQPKGAASFAASLTDLTGNGHHAGDPGGGDTPGWNAVDGWVFDAVNTQYLTTTFVPDNDQSQTMIVQFTGASVDGAVLAGSRDANDRRFWVQPRYGGSDDRGYANGELGFIGARVAAGNIAVAGARGYYNGSDEGIALGAWGGIAVNAVHIGRGNGVGQYFTGNVQAFILFDVTITGVQVAAMETEMAAL